MYCEQNWCKMCFYILMCLVIVSAREEVSNGFIKADIAKHPYMVALVNSLNGGHFSVGAIITPKTVITVAHCLVFGIGENLRTISQFEFTLLSGSSDVSGMGDRFGAESIILHPSYNDLTLDYDVALIITYEAITYTAKIQPISLATTVPPAGTAVTSIDWGVTATSTSNYQYVALRDMNVSLISKERCKHCYGHYGLYTNRILCAGFDEDHRQEVCSGDSGSVLVWHDQEQRVFLLGVGVFGMGCVVDDAPGAYFNVVNNDIAGFINENLKM